MARRKRFRLSGLRRGRWAKRTKNFNALGVFVTMVLAVLVILGIAAGPDATITGAAITANSSSAFPSEAILSGLVVAVGALLGFVHLKRTK